MKKTLIALAVAGFSFNAAAVDLADNSGVQKFASEINVAATGTVLGTINAVDHTASTAVNVTTVAGFSLAGDVYARIDLSGAKVEDIAGFTGAVAAAPNWTVSSIATDGSYAILKQDAPAIDRADIITFQLEVEAATKQAVGVTFSLFETAANAVNQTGSLYSKSGTLLSFTSAVDVKVEIEEDDFTEIDVAEGSTRFVAKNASTDLINSMFVPTAAAVAPAVLDVAGTPIADLTAGGQWTVEGPFVVGASIGGGLDLTAETAVEPVDVANALAVTYDVTNANDAIIAPGAIKAVWTPAAGVAAAYDISAKTIDPAAVLSKNGSTQELNLVMKPNGAFKHFVRISNTSAQEGNIVLTAINDAGDSKSITLGQVQDAEGNLLGLADTLTPGASTPQLSVEGIVAASGLAVGDKEKVRIVVEGEVPSLSAQSYVLSSDNTALIKFD